MSRKGQEMFFLFQTEESFVLHMSPTLKLRVSLISLKPGAEMQGEVSLPLPVTVSVTRGAAHSRTLIPHLTSPHSVLGLVTSCLPFFLQCMDVFLQCELLCLCYLLIAGG